MWVLTDSDRRGPRIANLQDFGQISIVCMTRVSRPWRVVARYNLAQEHSATIVLATSSTLSEAERIVERIYQALQDGKPTVDLRLRPVDT